MKSDPVVTLPSDQDPCPCGRTMAGSKGRARPLVFGACCGPLLKGEHTATDAEALMRSRYTAYVTGNTAYLRESWHPETCPQELVPDASLQWLGLKVLWHKPVADDQAEVAFVARYRQQGRVARLEEQSRFVREQGRWLYHGAVDAKEGAGDDA
ncbi:MAG: YchJ family metal-binding protein [Brachymonas sp.]|nr:YchJ family metal-binding protein [Brachymonas sp.]